MPDSAATRWSLTGDPALRLRVWDDDDSALGFDERSGDTFVVGPLALELMQMLAEAGPMTGDGLLASLGASLGTPPPTLAAAIAAELRRLGERGLVSPAT